MYRIFITLGGLHSLHYINYTMFKFKILKTARWQLYWKMAEGPKLSGT